MIEIDRILTLMPFLEKKSYFLWGPRQTGKSWLISHTLKDCQVYNLLDSDTYLRLSFSPKKISQEFKPETKMVVIDEIQKLPILLNEVHLLIESHKVHFLLTGSSARKLRREGVHLLGGRARTLHLHPFVYIELKEHFNLEQAMNHGLLPGIYFSDNCELDLKTYVGTYLKEEIAAEGLCRNIPAFSRFLEVAALCNGSLINYTKISNDAQVPRSTVQEYFQILKDTLIAYEVEPWKHSKKRKPLSTSKFYFFDPGVVRILQHRKHIQLNSPEFGILFETYIFHELKSFSDYLLDGELFYWRTVSGCEVDFILGNKLAIEVKSTSTISSKDLKGLRALQEENQDLQYIVISFETVARSIDGIYILPWRDFLTALWARKWI